MIYNISWVYTHRFYWKSYYITLTHLLVLFNWMKVYPLRDENLKFFRNMQKFNNMLLYIYSINPSLLFYCLIENANEILICQKSLKNLKNVSEKIDDWYIWIVKNAADKFKKNDQKTANKKIQ